MLKFILTPSPSPKGEGSSELPNFKYLAKGNYHFKSETEIRSLSEAEVPGFPMI